MATMNPFDLLVDNDDDDPSQLISLQEKKLVTRKSTNEAKDATKRPAQAKLPSKPLPPTQAVRELKNEVRTGRGDGRGNGRGGLGRGRGFGGGYNRDRDFNSKENTFPDGVLGAREGADSKPLERGRGDYGGPRSTFRGGHSGVFNDSNAEGIRPHRQFERRSGTGRGNELKREGSGRGNWGTSTEEELHQESEEHANVIEGDSTQEKSLEADADGASKENPAAEPEAKEPEDKEMTLEEYEKVLEEKRKALKALRMEERKVDAEKEFGSMQPLSSKKDNNDIFIKLGSEKDKKKDASDKEEKAKKSLNINEFFKHNNGRRGGRGRGRGGRDRGIDYSESESSNLPAPSISDPNQFPTLSVK